MSGITIAGSFLALAVALPLEAQRLSAANLRASVDTFENYTGPAGATVKGKTSYVRTIAVRPGGFEVTYTWLDSTVVTTVQTTWVRASDASTEWQHVRSATDSATLLTGNGHAAGWVVPQGQPALMFDERVTRPLLDPNVVELAFAAQLPKVGQSLAFNTYGLYSAAPLAPRADTMTVGKLVDLESVNGPIKAIEVNRDQIQFWFDATTGKVLGRQGVAAGGRVIWWHVKRGLRLPRM